MTSLTELVPEAAAEMDFLGVVQVDVPGEDQCAAAFGLADRRHKISNRVETRFGIASGTKGFTALAVVSGIEAGFLSLGSSARSLLGRDLPLVDDAVTVEHLLAHRSGIGDYIDESELTDINDYLMQVPVHQLAKTEDYVPVLDGKPQVSPPGSRFAYNNSGFALLALLLERVTGQRFEDLSRNESAPQPGCSTRASSAPTSPPETSRSVIWTWPGYARSRCATSRSPQAHAAADCRRR